MSPVLRLNGFRLGLLLAALAVGTGEAAFGEIRASGKNGLRTEVNGVRGGGCNKGVCRIGGGTNAGKNKFHRFQDFDTRGAIERVEFDTGGKHNLVVGVTSAKGTWINKMVALSSKANLFFLSPGGIHLGKGAGFINVPKLSLSTADQLRFAEGTFDVFHSTPESVAAFTTNPLPGVFGMRRSEMDKGVVLEAGQLPGIHLNGINISLDEELLVDAPGGAVNVVDSRLDVGTDDVGGGITLTGEAISINGGSELIASGRSVGGLIEVGGSWQNSDASVRQAVTAQVEHGAVLDASATVNGDGGEIVVWSDITDPQSLTAVAGSLWARGGSEGGDGGAIETSGFVLDIAGIDVQTSANSGENGLWLLDPYDYTIGSVESDYIVEALGDQNNVTISTASSTSTAGSNTISAGSDDDPSGGTITVDSEIALMCPSGNCGALTLVADKDIQINASVGGEFFEGSGLTLSSKTGVYINSNGAIAWDCSSTPTYPCGPVEISSSVSGGLSGSGPLNTGSAKLIVNQVGDTEFSGTVSGSSLYNAGGFEKQGAGKLTLSGAFNRTRGTTINGGTLNISGNQTFADNVIIASGATFSISASQPRTYSGIISGAGVFRKEGSGTLTLSGASTYSGNT